MSSNKQQKYKGHTFSKTVKKVYEPPIEFLAGGVIPAGLSDLTDWEAWETSKRKRKQAEELRKLDMNTEKGFLASLKGKSISAKTHSRINHILSQKRANATGDSDTYLTEATEIPLNIDAPSSSYELQYKPLGNKVDFVNIFSEGNAIAPRYKLNLRVEQKIEEVVKGTNVEEQRIEISETELLLKDPKLIQCGLGCVTMMSDRLESLPMIEKSKIPDYFGNLAKSKFMDTYRELDHRRKILWNKDGEAPEDELTRTIQGTREESPFTSSIDTLLQSGILRPVSRGSALRSTRFDPAMKTSLSSSQTIQDDISLNKYPNINSTRKQGSHYVSMSNDKSSTLGTSSEFNNSSQDFLEGLKKDGSDDSYEHNIPNLDLDLRKSSMIIMGEDDDKYDDFFTGSTYSQMSPRATFLAGCLKAGMAPRTSALLRRRLSTKLALGKQGIGDVVGLMLASCLHHIPFVSSLDLSDNNLTDVSIGPLFKAIQQNPNISEIDFSTNDIDSEAAHGLSAYLSSAKCSLKKLVLCASDIDDGETDVFVSALMNNKSLEELDLSSNLIGKDEVLNAVKPDLTTGGEAIAALLRADQCVLQTLKLSWNMIRMDSAMDMCDSISYNKTLTCLDLSYNSIGTEGGCVLGRALLTNNALKELHIKNNMIDPVGCFTICVGARETTSLLYMNLDGNPVGEAGARALMTIPLVCGARLKFSAKECDFQSKSSKIILNRRDPIGKYELNMESDYGRAVLFDIFDIIANHPSLIIFSYSYSDDEGLKWTNYQFEKFPYKKQIFTSRESQEIESQKYIQIVAQNESRIVELFNQYDEDGSGELDDKEFTALLNEFGIHCTEKEGKAIIASVDTDGGGKLELDEIITFIRKLGDEAPSKIMNLENRFCVCLKDTLPKERYFPPTKGRVRIQIMDSFVTRQDNVALTRLQALDMIDASKNSSNAAVLLGFGADNVSMRVDEAEMMHSEISKQSGNPIGVLSKLLPLVSSVYDSRRLLNYIVGDSQSKTLYLKKLLGPAYRPIIGIFDGYYTLDLTNDNDRVCLAKLFEQNSTITANRRRMHLWDVSQDGNWSCFRNESYSESKGDRPTSISVENFTPVPKHGHLEFDFSGSNRPIPKFDLPISNRKFLNILTDKLRILDCNNTEWALEYLDEMRLAEQKFLSGQGYVYWQADFARAKAVTNRVLYLYKNLKRRKDQLSAAQKKEFIAVDLKADENLSTNDNEETKEIPQSLDINTEAINNESIDSITRSIDTMGDPIVPEKEETPAQALGWENNTSFIRGDDDNLEDEEAAQSVSDEESLNTDKGAEKQFSKFINYGSHDTIAARLEMIAEHGGINIEAVCVCVMEYVETFMSTRWIKSAHLALLTACFETGRLNRTEFGSYRVELIILLYTRLLDIHNFEFVLMNLTANEHAAVLARIGYLNLFNPWKPEGAISLDMSHWEERQVAKMLAHISITEPGENWIRCEFCSERGNAPMPGWSLNVVWFSEDGFPSQGLLTVHQFSGDGMFRKACMADIALRAKLLSLVLISGDEICLQKQPMSVLPIRCFTFEDANASAKEVELTWVYASAADLKKS